MILTNIFIIIAATIATIITRISPMWISKDIKSKQWFKYLSAIALVNITMTGLIYHVLLATPPIAFQSHLTHTVTPILYILFYFGIQDRIN